MKADTSNRPSRDESIEARAAAWLAQRDAGWAEGEASRFLAWMAQDRRHAAAVQRLESVWSNLAELRNYRPASRVHPDPDILAQPSAEQSDRRLYWRWAFPAAAAAVLALLGALFWPAWNANDRGIRYATTSGGFARATLQDGSVVELNSDTALTVFYEPTVRRIVLEQGEAHFTVAHSAERPFWVESNGFSVRAVGTAFDVKRAQQGIEVLVTAGRVQLGSVKKETLPSAPSDSGAVVSAGWKAILRSSSDTAPMLQKIPGAHVREMLAWQSSRLSFVEMPLSEVVEQFNQRNVVQMHLADPELGNLSIGGSFAADNVDTFIRLLTSNGEVVADRASPETIVLRKAR